MRSIISYLNSSSGKISAKLLGYKSCFMFICVCGCCICIYLLIGAGFSYAEIDSRAENEKSMAFQIEYELSREREQFLRYESTENDLLEQLADIEKNVEEKQDQLKILRTKINSDKKELENNQKQLKNLEDLLVPKEALLGKRLVAYYKYAKRGFLQVLATAEDLDHLNHSMKYLNVIMNEDRKVIEDMINAQQKYRDEVSRIEEKIAVIAELEDDDRKKLGSLQKDLDKKVILLSKIHQEKEFYQTAVKELQLASKNLKGTLLRLDKKQTELKMLPSGFKETKGKLSLPVKGDVQASQNSKSVDNNLLKGIYINGTFGADVRAVYPGKIEFSGQLKGYGQVIIINHGDRYFTISAYLSHRDKVEDDLVTAGDIIGQVGETGLSTGPGLYFEIRQGGINLNSLEWLKVN